MKRSVTKMARPFRSPVGMASSAIPFVMMAMSSTAYAQSADNSASVAVPAGVTETAPGNNSATDSDTVFAAIVATNDSVSGINGATGGTAVVNAFSADTINGVAASSSNAVLSVATGSTVPSGLSFDPSTGNVDVAAGTAAGTYMFDYQICEALNPANCQVATITVEVVAAAIVADADAVSGVNGASGANGVVDVLDGDTLNGAPATLANVDISVVTPATPNNPGDLVPVLNPATGLVDVPAGTPAGTYMITYEICEELNSANCAQNIATITVDASIVVAGNDSVSGINGATGGTAVVNAFSADTINGVAASSSNAVLSVATGSTVPSGLSFDPSTGNVDVAAGTAAGTYMFDYQICEALNPANCQVATITVEVVAAAIVADADAVSGVNGASGANGVVDVLDGDTLNGAPATLANVDISVVTPATPNNPGDLVPVLNPATGLVDVPAGTPAGTYMITYEICEELNSANCAQNIATITVDASIVVAGSDSVSGINGATGGTAVVNAFSADTINGVAASSSNAVLSVATGSTVPSGLSFDPSTGNVDVAAGTAAGTYMFDYQICEALNPANCQVATITVEVVAAAIVADADAVSGVNGASGANGVVDVLDGDTLNGAPATLANVDISVVTPATPNNPGDLVPVLNPATGLVDVPAGTPAGTYMITYEICEELNSANCAQNIATITVDASIVVAGNDSVSGINGATGGTAVVNAFSADTINGVAASSSNAVLSVATGSTVPSGLSFDPSTGNVDVAAGTAAGTYMFDYQICEALNPANCQVATITVEVVAAAIVADADAVSGVNGASGANGVVDVLDGDTLNGAPATLANVDISVVTPATPNNPGDLVPVLNPATGLVDVPAGTPAGTYMITYEICEELNSANCAQNIATITVDASIVVAGSDSVSGINGATGGTAVVNAFSADTINGVAASSSNAVLSVATGSTVPSGLSFDPSTGNVDVAAGTAAGTYMFDYQICEALNPANCQVATITVEVVAAAIVADADAVSGVNGASGANGVVDVLDGDTLNGAPATLANVDISVVTPATPNNPGDLVPVLNPATGLVDVPAGTPAGTYMITYEICEELNSANCAQNIATITVDASIVVAGSDSVSGINGATGGTAVVNAFSADTINGVAASSSNAVLSVATGSTVPSGLSFDPSTGNVDVAAGTAAGTYMFDYQICEALNPANCQVATITVEVVAAAIVADADAVSGVNGASGANGVVDVLDGDTLNGAPATLANVDISVVTPATPNNPGDLVPVLNPATGLVDVPAGTPAGTYMITYEICEELNSANCAQNIATITVDAAEITATADTPAPVAAGIGVPNAINAFDNDELNGDPVDLSLISATVTSPAANSGVVLDPATGIVSVAADVPAGTYSIGYEICERLNPANCATSTVTVVVEPALSTVEGTVFLDVNGDDTLDIGDERRAGWIVEILRDGSVVETTVSDTQGNYQFENLLSGPGYTIRFRNPENNVVYGEIDDVELASNTTTVDQNLPIDPSGVIYDSVARTPVDGVIASLLGPNGMPLPTACFLDPTQQDQVTGTTGEYRFDIVPGATPQCPDSETEYTISVTPPSGFGFVSTVLLPQPGSFDPTGQPGTVRISDSSTAPTEANPTYFLTFALASGDPDVINNHIPIDPFLSRDPLIVTKTSQKRDVSTGDLVPYQIIVRNADNVQRAGVTVVDLLPPGLKFVAGSAVVEGVPSEPIATNSNRQLEWRDQVIPANGAVSYNLIVTVGAGVTTGTKVNTGFALDGPSGSPISNRGTAVVRIVPSSVFDCSELLGKVFEDTNRNGYQDKGEPGVPGVRLATVNGLLVTTDEFGRYHIACAAVPDSRIGSNFVLKLDPRTLPIGWTSTNGNPRSIRLTRGKFGELNFGVAPSERQDTNARDAGPRGDDR